MFIHIQLIMHVCVVMLQNPNIWKAKNIKKYCKSTRIMYVNWLFITVGMHYVQKINLIKENQNLLLNCGYFSLLSRVQHLLDSMLAVNFYVKLQTEVPKKCQCFQKKTESTSYTFQCYLQISGSDSKLPHLDQQIEKDWTFRLFKNKYICLIMKGNCRLEKVTPSLELVRISNHAIKGMIEANSWKNRSKLFKPSEINHIV